MADESTLTAREQLREAHRDLPPEIIAAHALDLAHLAEVLQQTLNGWQRMTKNNIAAIRAYEARARDQHTAIRLAASLANNGQLRDAIEALRAVAAWPAVERYDLDAEQEAAATELVQFGAATFDPRIDPKYFPAETA